MPELSLDDVDWHPLPGKLDRVRMPQLVRREPAANTRLGGELSQFPADGGGWPRAAAGGAIDDAEQRTDRKQDAMLEPAVQVRLIPSSE